MTENFEYGSENGAMWDGRCWTWNAWDQYYRSINAPSGQASRDWYASPRCNPNGTLAEYGKYGHLTGDQMPPRTSKHAYKYKNPLKESDSVVSWEDALNHQGFQNWQDTQNSVYNWKTGETYNGYRNKGGKSRRVSNRRRRNKSIRRRKN
jgi:hypothetical protein